MRRLYILVALALGIATAALSDTGAHAGGANLEGTAACEHTVVTAGTAFTCSLVLRNSGAVDLIDVKAGASLNLCDDDGECCVCILPGFPLAISGAEPRWTGRSTQYGFPYWDPLGSGTLPSGDSLAITVRVSAGRIGGSQINPDFLPAVRLEGQARVSEATDPTYAGGVVRINIVDRPVSDVPGDANCDGSADSTDALLVLQRNAALLAFLGCPRAADVNSDLDLTALDAILILQFAAGLIDTLPP
jgi:hypothetical protein